MIILDTNVISEFSRKSPSDKVKSWLDKQDKSALHLCAPVYSELVYGAALHEAKRGTRLYFDILEEVQFRVIKGEFLNFDQRSALVFGEQRKVAYLERKTRPVIVLMIAAICIANGATLATRNVADFEGLDVKLVNPFEGT